MANQIETKLTAFLVWCVIIVLAVISFGIFSYRHTVTPTGQYATWFDSFNILATAFSGLAFAGVIYAILLQKRELALQREELEATRAELRRSAEAQEQSQLALKDQVGALNKTVRISQSALEPIVIIYVAADESRPSILLLMIENIGRGAAKDVSFEFPEALPQRAWGIERQTETPERIQAGPLVTGIPFLPPSGTRKMAWGQYGGLLEALGEEPVRVTVRYKNLRGEVQPEVECLLDVKSFDHCDAVDPDGARQAAGHLESIAKEIRHFATGFRKLAVVTQTVAELREQQNQMLRGPAKSEGDAESAVPPVEGGTTPKAPVDTSRLSSEWAQKRPNG